MSAGYALRFYIGLPEVPERGHAAARVRATFAASFPGGGTVYEARGHYAGAAEDSLVCEVVYPASGVQVPSDDAIRAIARALGGAAGQEVVLVSRSPATYEPVLVGGSL